MGGGGGRRDCWRQPSLPDLVLVVTLLFEAERERRGRFLVNNSEASFPKEIDSFKRRRVWALIYNDDQALRPLAVLGPGTGRNRRAEADMDKCRALAKRERETEKGRKSDYSQEQLSSSRTAVMKKNN